jgi:hypothetical protein
MQLAYQKMSSEENISPENEHFLRKAVGKNLSLKGLKASSEEILRTIIKKDQTHCKSFIDMLELIQQTVVAKLDQFI